MSLVVPIGNIDDDDLEAPTTKDSGFEQSSSRNVSAQPTPEAETRLVKVKDVSTTQASAKTIEIGQTPVPTVSGSTETAITSVLPLPSTDYRDTPVPSATSAPLADDSSSSSSSQSNSKSSSKIGPIVGGVVGGVVLLLLACLLFLYFRRKKKNAGEPAANDSPPSRNETASPELTLATGKAMERAREQEADLERNSISSPPPGYSQHAAPANRTSWRNSMHHSLHNALGIAVSESERNGNSHSTSTTGSGGGNRGSRPYVEESDGFSQHDFSEKPVVMSVSNTNAITTNHDFMSMGSGQKANKNNALYLAPSAASPVSPDGVTRTGYQVSPISRTPSTVSALTGPVSQDHDEIPEMPNAVNYSSTATARPVSPLSDRPVSWCSSKISRDSAMYDQGRYSPPPPLPENER